VIALRTKHALFAATLLLGLPVTVVAQQPAAGPPPPAATAPAAGAATGAAPAQALTPEQQAIQNLFNEYQELHSQLQGLQGQALQDPQLSADQEALGNDIRVAMEAYDPMMKQRLGRVNAIETEASAAQAAGDMPKLQLLMSEAQEIEQHFMSVQESVMEQPEIAAKVDAFQSKLEQKMIQISPGAQALMTRFRALETQLQAAMQGGA
jgi:hypothetical protein